MPIKIDHAYTFIDKTDWGDGPWQTESDKLQWVDEATGLDCLLVRTPMSGHLCGYVGVPEDHLLFGEDYDNVDVDVHGGLTFSGRCREGQEETGICHIPQPGRPDQVWWFGFDAAHAWDVRPEADALLASYGLSSFPHDPATEYRTVSYMQAECTRLAAQLQQRSDPTWPNMPTLTYLMLRATSRALGPLHCEYTEEEAEYRCPTQIPEGTDFEIVMQGGTNREFWCLGHPDERTSLDR